MVWFPAIIISLKPHILKTPLTACYFWIFVPNVYAYCSIACFASTGSFAEVLLIICTQVNLEKWSKHIVATSYILQVYFHLRTEIICLEDIQFDWLKCIFLVDHVHPNTYGSGVGIVDEHDQPGIYISINQIEYPQGK